MDTCFEHEKPINKIFSTIKVAEGHWRSANYCPICNDLEHISFKCKKCKSKNDYYRSKNAFPYLCQICKDTGEIPDSSGLSIHLRQIPSWRLHMDDASPEEILESKDTSKDFGIQPQSEKKWKEYYEKPWEKKKMREFNKKQKQLEREVFG